MLSEQVRAEKEVLAGETEGKDWMKPTFAFPSSDKRIQM